MKPQPRFTAGRNIAVKVPSHEFAGTVAFYRDVLGLALIGEESPAIVFEFGGKRLWIDDAPHLSQAEVWLEVCTPDVGEAARYLESRGVVRSEALELLPRGFEGFWVLSPGNIVHLVSRE